MSWRKVCSTAFLIFITFRASGQIELVSFHQDLNPQRATLTIAIKSPETQVKTGFALEYPGYCGTIIDGKEKVMLSNSRGSIGAINCWSGSKINDSVAIALLPSGVVVYFPTFNHVVAEKLKGFKGRLEESSFRVTAVTENGVELEYNDHSSQGLLFHVLARISGDGKVEVRQNDIKD
jgi:hypothetical protein